MIDATGDSQFDQTDQVNQIAKQKLSIAVKSRELETLHKIVYFAIEYVWEELRFSDFREFRVTFCLKSQYD